MNHHSTISDELRDLLDDLADLRSHERQHRSGFFGARAERRHETETKAHLARDIHDLVDSASHLFKSAEKHVTRIPAASITGGLIAFFVLRRLFAHR